MIAAAWGWLLHGWTWGGLALAFVYAVWTAAPFVMLHALVVLDRELVFVRTEVTELKAATAPAWERTAIQRLGALRSAEAKLKEARAALKRLRAENEALRQELVEARRSVRGVIVRER